MAKYPKIILASKSPRRHHLLREAGFEFDVWSQSVPETYPSDMAPETVPAYLARKKAEALLAQLSPEMVLITADTVVILHQQIIEKPASLAEAKEMLEKLSGQTHTVVTGVHLATRQTSLTFSEMTRVFFKELHSEEIENYLEKSQPLDRAGAYGIQDWIGRIGVTRIEGCFYNVMGLPTARLYQEYFEFLRNNTLF